MDFVCFISGDFFWLLLLSARLHRTDISLVYCWFWVLSIWLYAGLRSLASFFCSGFILCHISNKTGVFLPSWNLSVVKPVYVFSTFVDSFLFEWESLCIIACSMCYCIEVEPCFSFYVPIFFVQLIINEILCGFLEIYLFFLLFWIGELTLSLFLYESIFLGVKYMCLIQRDLPNTINYGF